MRETHKDYFLKVASYNKLFVKIWDVIPGKKDGDKEYVPFKLEMTFYFVTLVSPSRIVYNSSGLATLGLGNGPLWSSLPVIQISC